MKNPSDKPTVIYFWEKEYADFAKKDPRWDKVVNPIWTVDQKLQQCSMNDATFVKCSYIDYDAWWNFFKVEDGPTVIVLSKEGFEVYRAERVKPADVVKAVTDAVKFSEKENAKLDKAWQRFIKADEKKDLKESVKLLKEITGSLKVNAGYSQMQVVQDASTRLSECLNTLVGQTREIAGSASAETKKEALGKLREIASMVRDTNPHVEAFVGDTIKKIENL